MGKWSWIGVLGLAAALSTTLQAKGAFDLERVVAKGDAIANRPGQVVDEILRVQSSQDGRVAFIATFGYREFSVLDPARNTGLFLLDQGSPQLVADLADLSIANPGEAILQFSINAQATIAITNPSAGVFVFPRLGPVRHVGRDDPAPVPPPAAVHRNFRVSVNQFLTDAGDAVFSSQLSDGRLALFRLGSGGVRLVAMSGGAVPDRPQDIFGELGSIRVQGDLLTFVAGGSLYIDDGTSIRTVAAKSQPLPGGGAILGVNRFDANRMGDVAFSVSGTDGRRQVLLYTGGRTVPLFEEPMGFPGFGEGSLLGLSPFYLDDQRRLYFAVADTFRGGIFLWQDGLVTKIAADGDTSPSGGVLALTVDETPIVLPPPPPRYFSLDFPRPGRMGDVAFEAEDTVLGRLPFHWRNGVIDAVELDPFAVDQNLALRSLKLLASQDDGTLLVQALVCCNSIGLYRAVPAGLRRSILPYLAGGGEAGSLRIGTQVELSNSSHFTVGSSFTAFSESSDLFNPFQYIPFLAAGDFGQIPSRSNGAYATGFAEIDTEGGSLQSNALIRLERGGSLISLVNIPASQPVQSARLMVDQSAGADTGVAVSNPGPSPIDLALRLANEDGAPAGETTLRLESGEQVSRLASQLFAAGGAPDFLGSIEIESLPGQGDFAVAGLRQSQLLLSSLPPASVGGPDPARGLSAFASDWVTQTLPNEAGEVAIATFFGTIHVITPTRDSLIVEINTPLPDREFASPSVFSAALVDFDADELLFARDIGSSRTGLYLWKDGQIESVVVGGQSLDGITVALPLASRQLAEAFDRNANGLIAAGGQQIIVHDGTPRVLLTSDTPIGPGGDPWGAFEQVAVGADDTVYFRTNQAIGRAIGSRVEVLSRSGAVLQGTSLVATRFDRIELAPSGDLLVGVTTNFGGAPTGVLARYSEGLFHPILSSLDAAPGMPGFAIILLDTNGFQVNAAGETVLSADVSSAEQMSVKAFFKISPSGQTTLLASESRPGLAGFPAGAEFQYPLVPTIPYLWSDAGALLFTALDRRGVVGAFLVADGAVSVVVSNEEVFSGGPGGPGIPFEYFSLAQFLPDNSLLFNARLPVGDTETDVTLRASPEGFQEGFLALAASGDFSGARFDSRVLLLNQGTDNATVEVAPTKADGEALPTTTVQLAPLSVRALDLDLGEGSQGWVRLRSKGGRVSFQERLAIHRGAELVTEATVAPSGLRRSGVIDTRFSSARQTGLALANPWHGKVAVELTLDTGNPETSPTETVFVEGQSQRSFFLSEIFPPNGDAPTEGIVRIESRVPVAMISLRQEGLVLTTQGID